MADTVLKDDAAEKLAADLKAAAAKVADKPADKADAKPAHDAKTLELLDKLCAHFGVPQTGDVAQTTQALSELTGHAGLSPEALIHELADLTGHR